MRLVQTSSWWIVTPANNTCAMHSSATNAVHAWCSFGLRRPAQGSRFLTPWLSRGSCRLRPNMHLGRQSVRQDRRQGSRAHGFSSANLAVRINVAGMAHWRPTCAMLRLNRRSASHMDHTRTGERGEVVSDMIAHTFAWLHPSSCLTDRRVHTEASRVRQPAKTGR